MAKEKKCPKCAESVKVDAKVCRYCTYQFPTVALASKMSLRTKILIGLGGLVGLSVLTQIGQSQPSGTGSDRSDSNSTVDVDPGRKDKDMAAYLAKQAVPAALKDPSSADFGDVWGMSPSLACGFVNAKNSFGAMAGRKRFIFSSGSVAFENSNGTFAKRWNATCVDKPHTSAPTGAAGMRWGSRPAMSLKQFAPTTNEGLAIYVPKAPPEPLDGVPVAEADYSFDHMKLWAADFYIDGVSNRNAILKKFVRTYGAPQQYNEDKGRYSWKWPAAKVSLTVNYDSNHGRTSVGYSRDSS